METPVMTKGESPSASLEDCTASYGTLGLSIKDENMTGYKTTFPASQKQTSEARFFTSKLTPGMISNFLGVGGSLNAGTNNFLGVGENFLGVGETTSSGSESVSDVAGKAEPIQHADIFLQAGNEVHQDSDHCPRGVDSQYPDVDHLDGAEKNAFVDADNSADSGENAFSDPDDFVGQSTNPGSDPGELAGAGKSAPSGTDNFLGIALARNFGHVVPDHFLGAAENSQEVAQDSEPWVEVKIEIDVADTEFVTEPNMQMSSQLLASLPKNHLTRCEKDSSELVRGEQEMIAKTHQAVDRRSSHPKRRNTPQREDKSHRAEARHATNFDASGLGLGTLAPWQIKVEPDSDDSEGKCSASLEEVLGGGGSSDRQHCLNTLAWSADHVQENVAHEDKELHYSLSKVQQISSPTKAADPQAPDTSLDFHIKQEPVALPDDHVSQPTDHTGQMTGGADATERPLGTSSQYPDFVIKMEPESDEETVVEGVMDLSHEESPSSTEDEESLAKKQKPGNKTAKKTPSRREKAHPYQCQYCDSTFLKKSRLREHTRIHTDERPYKCEECNISFRKAESLKVHTRTHTGELPFCCKECECAFKCSQELKRHVIRKHTAVRPFSCPHCEARFFSQPDLRGHIRVHTGEKPYKCSDCHAAFRKSSALTCHMRIHTGQKPYACSECDRAFRRSDQLKRHMKLHTGEKPFECNECDAAFTSTTDLKKHCARKHSLVKPFSCPECGNKFFTNEDLKMHRIFHMGIKPHSCSECGAAFVRASDLKVHMRIHTGEKPFSCSICSATFARSGDLRLHLRMHEDKRPFTCSICNLSFRRSGHLTRHMNTHNGQKTFRCEDCDAAFFTSSDLKRHASRVHKKDISKFSCTECDAGFFTSRALSIHMMKHTGEKPFQCTLCHAAFSHADLLNSHMEVHGAQVCKTEPAAQSVDDAQAFESEEPGTPGARDFEAELVSVAGSDRQDLQVESPPEVGGQYMYVDVSVIAAEPGSESHCANMPAAQV